MQLDNRLCGNILIKNVYVAFSLLLEENGCESWNYYDFDCQFDKGKFIYMI